MVLWSTCPPELLTAIMVFHMPVLTCGSLLLHCGLFPAVLGPYSDAGKYRTGKDPSDKPESMWDGAGRL